MADFDLHNEYNSTGECIQDLFDSTEEGFWVPLYQRGYTWEEENINQLFEDLVMGVQELASEDSDSATTFLGAAILTMLGDKKLTVRPGEERAQPTAVQVVIDGQQRISTLALISIQVIVKLRGLIERLADEDPYLDLRNAGLKFTERLGRLHAIELGKGADPPCKPKIIRAEDDLWTYDGDDNTYGSPVARYIASFIRENDAAAALKSIKSAGGKRVRRNVAVINRWLDQVCDAHIAGSVLHEQFPQVPTITSPHMQEYVLGFTDDSVKNVVERAESDKDHPDYCAAAVYQLLLLTHYLLRRCGVNRLQPKNQDWGFDMFQALNATGTPLTVIETFLPTVMQAENSAKNRWDKTPSSLYMEQIRNLFNVTATNQAKSRRTDELLGAFSLCYEGQQPGNKFSKQRRWLTDIYEKDLPTIAMKREFLEKLARTANFFYFAWYMEESAVPNCIDGLEAHPEGELASLLVRYLKDAGSRLSAPVLARFYGQAVHGEASFDEFVKCAKACAAFFTLWRSASPGSGGLPDIYRKFFKGSDDNVPVNAHCWLQDPKPLKAKDLKRYFLSVLQARDIARKEAWIEASSRILVFSELEKICRFALFVAAHERIADDKNPGLTADATEGSCPLLTLERWVARDHRSIEHIAPQSPRPSDNWNSDIYDGDRVHHLGNLMLLPPEVNTHISNYGWAVKYLHYCHVGVRDQAKLNKLKKDAQNKGIVLKEKATTAFSRAKYDCAVEPVTTVGESGTWDADIIDRRTQQIKEITWDRLIPWLKP